jgi:ubiquinone/menaquinone biosynthesis C-methylase UbiE
VKKHRGDGDWSKFDPENFLPETRNHPIREKVFQRIRLTYVREPFDSILEVGFGSAFEYGRMKTFFEGSFISYTGADITERFVEHASRKYPEASWVSADVRDLGFGDGEFDWVLMYHVLEHLPGLQAVEKAFSELSRVVRRGVWIGWFLRPRSGKTSSCGGSNFPYYHYNVNDLTSRLRGLTLAHSEMDDKIVKGRQECFWELRKETDE